MLKQGMLALTLVVSAGLAQVQPLTRAELRPQRTETSQPVREAGPAIEVVFVLDTTGSMSGLIEGAKQKIWSIANEIATARPRPAIRMGLVGYRDRGDDYITVSTPLTDDLDAVYSDLMGYEAAGGGDGPESVNQALHEAVTSIAWTPRDELDRTLRIVYLVGDAPPHMDYEQDVKYHRSCEEATRRGIIINTIQCGSMVETAPVWREIARLGEGEYFAIEQSGGVVAIATPYDEELESLSARLADTLIAYGSPEEQEAQVARQARSRRLNEEAGAPAAAERALYLAKDEGGATLAGSQELVRDLAAGEVRLEEISESELPPEMRDLDAEGRRAYVEARAQDRARLQERMRELGDRRAAFLREETARLGAGERDAFDQKVVEALREQAARVGIRYE